MSIAGDPSDMNRDMSLGASLREARTAARLTADQLAKVGGIDGLQLELFEQGDETLSASEVDRCARALGLRIEDLELWTGRERTLPALLRDALGPDIDIGQILAGEVHSGLGEFQRAVRHFAALEIMLGARHEPWAEVEASTLCDRGRRGEELANRVRERFGLGLEPIGSMKKLVEDRLGIIVMWATTNHLDSRIDGASTRTPRPAIVVNLLAANRYPWRARTTLAHLLCHMLFDHQRGGTLFSPSRATISSGELPEELLRIETVARAFSVCLLAPTAGVKRAVGSTDPSSEQAIRRVGETYGVGRQVAINRLSRVFFLPKELHAAMRARRPDPYEADFSGDEVGEVHGFRDDPLRSLVGRALVARKIHPSHARRILGLASTDPLPSAVSES